MKRILIIAYSVFVCILLGACISIAVNSSGRPCTSYSGFAFDREQNLYLGKDNVISIIDTTGNELREIPAPTSRGYKFTIVDGEYILIYTGTHFCKTDLLGNGMQAIEVTDENRGWNR